MQTKRNLIQICLLCAALLPAAVQAQFTFTTNNGALTITGYTGPGGAVVIPDSTNGLPVTIIRSNVFFNITSMTSVTIPGSITNIGEPEFVLCTSLTNISVAAGNPAYSSLNGGLFDKTQNTLFQYPIGLTNKTYTVPVSVTSIKGYALFYCRSLTNISVAAGNPAYSSLNGVLFDKAQLTLFQYPIGQTNWMYTVPVGVTNVGSSAFYACTNLTSVTVPDSVSILGGYAFQNCASLTNVMIGNGLTNLGDWAFSGCSSLKRIFFQGNAPSLEMNGGFVFNTVPNVTVYYQPGTSGWSSSFAGRPAVMLNPPNPAGSLKVTLSPTAAITNGARWQVDGGIMQPGGATVSGLSVGNHTVSFTPHNGWAMPASQTIAVTAFSTATASGSYGQLFYTTNNGRITIIACLGASGALILPGTINGLPVTAIGNSAFQNSADLTNITIGTNFLSIGQFAFQNCTKLMNATIGTNVTSIGNSAFLNCSKLASVTISSSVTNIGFASFGWCTSLGAITVDPANLFYSSTNGVLFNKNQTILVQVPGALGGSYTMPNSVTGIRSGAFAGSSLTNVIISTNVTSIDQEAFEESGLTSITIPDSVTNIGVGAFQESGLLTRVTIPSSVTSIDLFAFAHCYNLQGIYFQGNAPNLDSALFMYDYYAVAYYLPWTTGWATFDTNSGLGPAMPWLPQAQTGNASFGVRSNQFGFNITWASDMVVVVEACTDLANPDWTPLGTNTLTGGSSYFSDSQWTNYPSRFYRLRSP